MIRANRENREWENEAWDKQADKVGESREQAQEDPIQKRENGQTDITGKNGNHIELISIIGEIEGGRRCKLRIGTGGDDCFAQQTDRFTGHRGQPFDRCAARSGGRSLFYCPDRDDDGTSGTDDGDGDRCRADI